MSEMTDRSHLETKRILANCPEPCAVLAGDELVETNKAFRAEFGDIDVWSSCIDPADRDKFPGDFETSLKFVARPALGSRVGIRMSWTVWRIDEKHLCVRLDGPAGPDIPEAIQPFLAEPLTLAGMIAGKLAERLETTMWSISKDGTILVSEGEGLVHFGVKPGQIVGLNAFQIYPDGSAVKTDLETTLVRGERVLGEEINPTTHWLRVCEPIRNERDEITAMVGFAWCATDLAREMNQARTLLRAVAEMPVTVWAMDPDGTCTLSVGKGLAHFGLKSGQLVGKNLLQVYPANSETHADILRSLQGESVAREIRIGEMTWFSTILPVYDGLGQNILQIFGVAENVTERSQAQRRLEEQLALIQSQQSAIAALTSPIIEVWQGVLVVPLIGSLDGDRAGRLVEHLLAEVVSRQSRAVILDLTGTQVVDPSTAQNLFDIMRSVRLLGAEGLVSGIRPNVAKTMVELDIAGAQWKTFPTLAEALRRIIGKRINSK